MILQPTYYSVFYDTAKPKNHLTAMQKRIPERQYLNLIDGHPKKTVELRSSDGVIHHYEIISQLTFHVFNTVDNTYFAVFDCKKILAHNLYPVQNDKINN